MAKRDQIEKEIPEKSALVETPQAVDIPYTVWPPTDLEEIIQTVLENLDRLIDCDARALLLLSDDTLRVVASRGLRNPQEIGHLEFNAQEQSDLLELINDGRPVISRDGEVFAPFTGIAYFADPHACIKAPLVYQDRPIGLLVVLKFEIDHYTEQDAQFAMAFAHQAATAIENARLYTETRRRALQLEAASQVGQKVTAILDLDELLEQVVKLIHDVFGYYHVHIFLVDGTTNEIVLRQSSGHAVEPLKTAGLRYKIGGQGIAAWVAQSGQPLLSNDVSQEPRYISHKLLPETRAELALPLQVSDIVVGVLDVQSNRRGAFNADDVTALQVLAHQIAVAIENANLFEQTRRQYEAMRAMHDISLEITAQLESEDGVLAAILKHSTDLLNAKGSNLMIYDLQTDVVRIIAGHNTPSEYEGVALRPGEGAAGRVVATGKPLVVNNYREWSGRSPLFTESPFDAIVGVPLRWQGQVFGALMVLDHGERRPFTDDDVRLLSLFADLASIALKNAELYEKVTQASHQLEQKVEHRTAQLAQTQQELAHKAEQLKQLLAATVHVQEEERTRIARDLHDGSNQIITATLFEIQAAQQSVMGQRDEVALEKLETAKQLLRQIEAENRRIIAGLHPSILDAQGLVAALKWHANAYGKQYQIACTVEVAGQPLRLSSLAEITVYRIVQESLNNVAQHAQAQSVKIQIEFLPTRLQIVIEDDGVGFDYESVMAAVPGRMGLIGIRERAQSIGGEVRLRSLPKLGTRIALDLPLPTEPVVKATFE